MKTPRYWQTNHSISRLLAPASALYALGAWADRRFTTPQQAPLPVIAVGNVTAGGAGKTPAALALIPLLRAMGHTPHILTRGYRGASLTAHRVSAHDDWRMVGDEALLLANAAPTWVGRNRFASAHAAAANGATILVCDDALQHHALHKNLTLLVIDGAYGIGNGKLLPAGPLRETLAHAAKRCDAAIIIGDDAQQLATQLSIPVITAQLVPTSDTAFLSEVSWLAFAGIGRPEKFFATLRALGATLTATESFPDHHAYSAQDITQLIARAQSAGATLITTEKDAVKIPPSYADAIRVLPVNLLFDQPSQITEMLHKFSKP
jgi:tetraacyldisaccharide 4'-kinase